MNRMNLVLDVKALWEEDLGDARTYHGEEAFIASQGRRAWLDPHVQDGALQTADDYYHAAFIYQHGERLEHWAMAHLLARTAADLGHPRASYMVAAGHDRWLMRQGKPQKYGTNSLYDGERNRVWDYDPRTTDEERAALGVPLLAELVERPTRLPAPSPDPQPFAEVTVGGEVVQLTEVEGLLPGRDFPVYAFPPYLPLRPDDSIPPDLPDAVTLWRFGRLCVAQDLVGVPQLTWHRCQWAALSHPSPSAAGGNGLLSSPASWGDESRPLHWLSPESAIWQRVLVRDTPTLAWLVGGTVGRERLENVAVALSTLAH